MISVVYRIFYFVPSVKVLVKIVTPTILFAWYPGVGNMDPTVSQRKTRKREMGVLSDVHFGGLHFHTSGNSQHSGFQTEPFTPSSVVLCVKTLARQMTT